MLRKALDPQMIGLNPDCPPSVALLADHLDTALAAGEDLLASTLAARSDLDEADAEAAPDALDQFVRHLMRLEASFLLRMLQARRLAIEIGRVDGALKGAGALFKAQTDILQELILRAGQTTVGELSRPGDCHAYLRSRGLIAPEAAAPSPFECLTVSDTFRIGGVAPLGLMLDLVSSLLDLLDARFGLYGPDVRGRDEPAPAGLQSTGMPGTTAAAASAAGSPSVETDADADGRKGVAERGDGEAEPPAVAAAAEAVPEIGPVHSTVTEAPAPNGV